MTALTGFTAALRSELFVAARGRTLPVLLALPAAAAAARVVLAKVNAASQQAREALLGQASAVDALAWGPFVDGLGVGIAVTYVLITGLACASIAGDREQGSVRHLLTRRVSRTALVASRFVFVLGAALAVCAALVVAAWLAATACFEFGPVVEDGYELIGVAEIRAEITRGLWLALAPLPATVAFGLCVSVLARSATAAVATGLGLGIAFDLFKTLLGDVALFIWATFHPALNDHSYLSEVAKIVRGYSDVLVEEGVLRLNVLVPIPEALLFLGVAIAMARRRKM